MKYWGINLALGFDFKNLASVISADSALALLQA